MHKKRNIIIGSITAGILIIGLVIYSLVFLQDPIAKQYPNSNLGSNHVFKEININELYELIESGDKIIVLVSNPACGVCSDSIGDVNKYAKENGIKRIFYLRGYQNDSLDKLTDDDVDDFKSKFEINGERINLGIKPQILVFENKEIIDYDGNYDFNVFVKRVEMIIKTLTVVE